MNIVNDIILAQKSIEHYLKPTPLIFASALSKMMRANIYLKLENMQPTTSFKVRGAFNKLLSLTAEQKQQVSLLLRPEITVLQ